MGKHRGLDSACFPQDGAGPPRLWTRGGVRGARPGTGTHTPRHTARRSSCCRVGRGGGSRPRTRQLRAPDPLPAPRPPPSKARTPRLPSLLHRRDSAFLHVSRLLEIFCKPEEKGHLHVHARQACCLRRSSHTRSPLKYSAWKGGQSNDTRTTQFNLHLEALSYCSDAGMRLSRPLSHSSPVRTVPSVASSQSAGLCITSWGHAAQAGKQPLTENIPECEKTHL